MGGAAVTEEFYPGFRNSVYSYSVSLLHPKVIRELQLEAHGLNIMERPVGTLSLLEDDHLLLSRADSQANREIARFSLRDAERIHEFENEISVVALPPARHSVRCQHYPYWNPVSEPPHQYGSGSENRRSSHQSPH